MLSSLLINQQKFVLFVDQVGMERFSEQIVQTLFKQQGQTTVEIHPLSLPYNLNSELSNLTDGEVNFTTNTNVILQPLSKLLCVYKLKSIFQLIDKFKKNPNVKQVFLWASTKNISDRLAVSFVEYLSDQIVTISDLKHLAIITRKTGGSVSNKNYQYQLGNGDFTVKEIKRTITKPQEPEVKPETTFKIELEEEEMIARNSVKMAYERTSDMTSEAQIHYIPDAADDFDEEDPDDDLDF